MRPKTYWYIVKQLISNPKYYSEVITAPFGLIFRFFLISVILLSLSSTLRVNLRVFPHLEHTLAQSLEELKQRFPKDLEVSWDHDHLALSPSKNLAVPYPKDLMNATNLPPLLANITTQELIPSDFATAFDEQSLLVVTAKEFYLNDLQGSWTNIKLTDLLPDKKFIVNTQSVPHIVTQVETLLAKMMTDVKKIDYLVMPVVLFVAKFGTAMSSALLVFLFMKLNLIKISFKQTLQLSLTITVVATLISQISLWLYPDSSISMDSLSYWIIFSFIFWTQRKRFSQLNYKQS